MTETGPARKAQHSAAPPRRVDGYQIRDATCLPMSRSFFLLAAVMVPTERLELSRLSPPPPQDGVSTNSTTSAETYFGMSWPFPPSGAGAAGAGAAAAGAA